MKHILFLNALVMVFASNTVFSSEIHPQSSSSEAALLEEFEGQYERIYINPTLGNCPESAEIGTTPDYGGTNYIHFNNLMGGGLGNWQSIGREIYPRSKEKMKVNSLFPSPTQFTQRLFLRDGNGDHSIEFFRFQAEIESDSASNEVLKVVVSFASEYGDPLTVRSECKYIKKK